MEAKIRKRVTATDVAKRAGVSQAAVSFAMRGSPEVSQELTARILKLARSMDYYPNAGGQLLRSRRGGRVGQLGIIVASTDSIRAFTELHTGGCIGHFVQYCSDRNLRYFIECHHHRDDETGFTPPHHAAAGLCDGSVLIGDVGDGLRQWLERQVGYAWVSVYEPAEYCVLPRADEGMFQAVRALVQLGHRRIACNIGPPRYLTHRLRLEGLRRAIGEFGLEMPAEWLAIWDTPSYLTDTAYRWAGKILSSPGRPTAIVAGAGAQPILQCATELGLVIPRDLSLVSWSSAADALAMHPQLAVVEQDLSAMMRSALDMLQQRIEGRAVEIKTCWMTPQLILHESVGPAPNE